MTRFFVGWATVEIEAVRWVVNRCMTKSLKGFFFFFRTHGHETYNLFSPESHLGVIETMMVIIATGAIYETMATVKLTSNVALELFVRFELRGILLNRWGNIVFTRPLFRFGGSLFGLGVTVSNFRLMRHK